MVSKKDDQQTNAPTTPPMGSYVPTADDKQQKNMLIHPATQDLADYQASWLDGTKPFRGLATGLQDIDQAIGGLDRFVLLAGRSGAGKTTLALQFAQGILKRGTPVVIYSYEMARGEILTSLLKLEAHDLVATQDPTNKPPYTHLHTNTIELRGNDPALQADYRKTIDDAMQSLNSTVERLYIRDSQTGILPILPPSKTARAKDTPIDVKQDAKPSMLDDIEYVKHGAGTQDVLVIVDSVQDIVATNNPNQVQAEIEAVNDLTRSQQMTGATILVTAQKNKGSVNSTDSYGDVMGSMSFIHKPNTALELVTVAEVVNKLPQSERARYQQEVRDLEADAKRDFAKPMLLNVIKGRFTGTGSLPLMFYGAWGYFDTKADPNYKDMYSILER